MLDPIAVATPHVGPVVRADLVNGFVGNRTFRLHTAAGAYYLKSGATVAEEAHACNLARAAGVPAPEVVVLGPEYLITVELPGRPLEPAKPRAAVLRAAGQAMRRTHSIAGAPAAWGARLRGTLDNLEVLPSALAGRVREVVPPFLESVSEVAPVLLHGDLHLRHLFAVDDELSGVLDWGDTAYGDPLFDLARLSMAGPDVMSAFLRGYGVVDLPARTLSCYRVLWSLMALQAEHRAGGDWFQAHLDTIAREVS
jgi:Ser/Thr protein kinase RdoA (MazF antagonist)